MPATSIEDAAPPLGGVRTLIDDFLAEQGRLRTPVARVPAPGAAAAPFHRDLIPLSAPAPGEQYAFEVDLDRCTGCKACVAACHSLNGLDEGETWRDVGLVLGADEARPFAQVVTTACHHCADPACLNGCPVLAYEKDPVTGIVVHLDDQCIGCSYCVLKCPYDAPKFNRARGIVRKCDMCHGRLAHGEAPACVQACPTEAIRIVKVPVASAGEAFLPAAPDPAYTGPTTRYVSARPQPSRLLAADDAWPLPQDPHWPLVVLLTLFPLAIGSQAVGWTLGASPRALDLVAWAAGAAGMAGSVAHLGQPLRAWRIFLGLRRSWLSREAVLLAAWAGLAGGVALVSSHPALRAAAVAVGLAALACSVMVYADTRRAFWRLGRAGPRFFGSAFILGASAVLAVGGPSRGLAFGLALAFAAKLALELSALFPGGPAESPPSPDQKTARLLAGPLRPVLRVRIAFGLFGGLLLPLASGFGLMPPAGLLALPLLNLVGEGAERCLFFRAVAAPRMPGGPAP